MKKLFKMASFGLILSLPACSTMPMPLYQCLQGCKETIIKALIEDSGFEVINSSSNEELDEPEEV